MKEDNMTKKAARPLRFYIIAIIVTTALVFGILISSSSLLVSRHYSRKQSEESHGITVNMLRIHYIEFFKNMERELAALGEQVAASQGDITNLMRIFAESFPHYSELFLADKRAEIFKCCGLEMDLPASFIEELQKGKRSGILSHIFDNKGDLSIALAYPVPNRNDYVVGILTLEHINEHLEVNRIYRGETGHPYLLDSRGKIVVHNNKELWGESILDIVNDKKGNRLGLDAFTGASYILLNYILFDEPRLVGVAEVEPYGWIAGFSQHEREAYASFYGMMYTLLPISIILVLLSLAIASDISTRFLGVIEYLSHKVRDMLNNNVLTPIKIHNAPKEIEILKDGINKLVQDLVDNSLGAVEALILTIEARDQATRGHSQQVVLLVEKVAQVLNIPPEEKETLRTAAILHDIGKLAVPDKILLKPSFLTKEEYNTIKKHPRWGKEILAPMSYLKREIEIVYQHHERPDGHGYPRGLANEEIDPLASIIATADALEAMLSDRPYRKALPLREALAELVEGKGTQFDPQVVEVFLQLNEKGELNFLLENNIKYG